MTASLLVVLLGLSTAACQPARVVLRMATTTSVDNSGLLADVLPVFENESHIKVDVLAVGSGQALNLIARGEAAVGLTHDPSAEAAALSAGTITGYRKIMFNDFVIVGPQDDPAGVAHASDAADAFARIAAADVAFVSRGDASGTYSREQALWTAAKRRPSGSHLLDAGQGMGGTLRVASERNAYTLADRATFEQFRASLRLSVLFQGGPALLNTYAVFIRAAAQGLDRTNAEALARWFADGGGRPRVAAFTAHGQRVFRLWPQDASRTSPADMPLLELAHAR